VVGLAIALAALGGAARAEADSDGAKPLTGTPLKMSGSSSIVIKRSSANTIVARERNVSFHLFRDLTPMLLLREQTNIEDEVPPKEDDRALISVDLTATPVGADGSAEAVRYRIHEAGDGALLYGALYVVSKEGCCDSQDGHVVYSVETGKRLLYTTGSTPVGALESLQLAGPGDHERWIGVYGVNSSYDRDVFAKGSDKLAVVTYATDAAPVMRAVLAIPNPMRPYFDRLDVRSTPGKAGGDPSFTVHVQFYGDVFADIPVVNDALDVAHATGSAGMTVRRAPLDGKL
jgi:hypothetical protein